MWLVFDSFLVMAMVLQLPSSASGVTGVAVLVGTRVCAKHPCVFANAMLANHALEAEAPCGARIGIPKPPRSLLVFQLLL